MGKRLKQVSMRTVFIRYLLLTGVSVFVLALAAFAAIILLQKMGVIYSPSAGAQACSEAVSLVREMSLDTFSEEKLPKPCRYAVFQTYGANAAPVRTNMDDRYLEAAVNAWKGGSGNLGYSQYHLAAELKDGAVCWLQYDYAVQYVDPGLQKALPDFQLTWFLLLLLMAVIAIALITRHYVRLLARETAILARAGARIYVQEPADGEQERAEVREFGQALATLDGMKKELDKSLSEQWRMRQERNDSIAALTHDLKTPLTVIGGNAELLEEEPLSEEQSLCVDMILHNVEHAREYLDQLRQLCIEEEERVEAIQRIELSSFFTECCEAGEALCRTKRIRFQAACDEAGENSSPKGSFWGYQEELLRALTNVMENAVRYTPADGQISLCVCRKERDLRFTVQDAGPGFSREALKKAGNMLYTSDGSRPQEGHRGMGLYFARRIAKKHGGTLTCSNTAQGGCVTLVIPSVK